MKTALTIGIIFFFLSLTEVLKEGRIWVDQEKNKVLKILKTFLLVVLLMFFATIIVFFLFSALSS